MPIQAVRVYRNPAWAVTHSTASKNAVTSLSEIAHALVHALAEGTASNHTQQQSAEHSRSKQSLCL